MLTLSAILIFAVMGLAVDVGWAHFRKQAAQAAADSAALAAAQAAYVSSSGSPVCGTKVVCQAATPCPTSISSPPSNNLLAGCLYAKTNGFVASGNQNVTMAANTTNPPSAPGAAVKYWINVSVTETETQLFSAILGNKYLNVGANATAAVITGGSGGCVYVLDPSAEKSLWETASGDLESPCGVWVDSSSAKAVYQTASSKINASPGGQVQIVGGYYQTGSATITPTPVTAAATFSDPLASMPTPTYSSTCDHTNFSLSGSGTLSQGTYCGGISITGSGSTPVTFNPGLYVMLGGGFNMAGSVGATGTGVTVLLTGNSTYSYQGISINGSGSYSFSAPTSGADQNMLFIKDRTQAAGTDTITGTSGMNITGIVYLPGDALTYTGGSNASSQYTMIVCDTLKLTGLTYINTNFPSSGYGFGGKLALIE